MEVKSKGKIGLKPDRTGTTFEARPLIDCPGCDECLDLFRFPGFKKDGGLFYMVKEDPFNSPFSINGIENYLSCPFCSVRFWVEQITI